MSQEEALEEDRREVMELLDKPLPPDPPAAAKRNRNSFQPPPTQRLLDVSPGPLPTRHGSIAGIGVGVTTPSARLSGAHSLCEPASSPLRLSSSVASSPARSQPGSEGSSHASSGGSGRSSIQLDIPPSVVGLDHTAQTYDRPPSRAFQGRSANAAVMGGFDLRAYNTFTRGRDYSRRCAHRGLSLDSRIRPSCRPSGRSLSPQSVRWDTNPFDLAARSEKIITEQGKIIEKSTAHRYLSDEALAQSSGSLARLAKPRSCQGWESDGARSSGEERLEKDPYDSGSNAAETSEEECDTTSSEDETGAGVQRKGSKRGRKGPADIGSPTQDGAASARSNPPQTQLAAAEEERQMVESAVAGSETTTFSQQPKNLDVHPQMSFDHTESAVNTPFGSDDEAELCDIKKAQKLDILMSSIDNSIHNRTIRTITRGDYNNTLEEADGTRRRQRKYLVATDLSEESVYALEWTIGTILREGDTLFAVCALHEEASANPPVQIGEGSKAAPDVASIVGTQTEETTRNSQHDASTVFPRTLLNFLGQGTDHRSHSADSQGMCKAEMDRIHTVQTISQTCVRLLRKTMLQVRIAVEVIHCKSPKHMITEAIDGLEPTLVIVGARGTGALKGVLLGSFSNYLVGKSSVPVMVARKKLKSQPKQKKNVRLSNNLNTPKRLALARVD